MNEYNMIKRTLQNETFPGARPWLPPRTLMNYLMLNKQQDQKEYQIILGKFIIESNQVKSLPGSHYLSTRNPFYVDTVRSFRDRRYEFKGLAKVWKESW